MIYSPLPQGRYRIPIDSECEFAVIEGRPFGPAIWNMYWLSHPSVDKLPTVTKDNWWRFFEQVDGLGPTLIGDVEGDDQLLRHLHMPPLRFLSWWQKQDWTIYDAYDLIGAGWPHRVKFRALEAAERMHRSRFSVERTTRGQCDIVELAAFRRSA